MIGHPVFVTEPWCLREAGLDLDVLAQTESVFALSNGHIGWRGNLGNCVFKIRPLAYAERSDDGVHHPGARAAAAAGERSSRTGGLPVLTTPHRMRQLRLSDGGIARVAAKFVLRPFVSAGSLARSSR